VPTGTAEKPISEAHVDARRAFHAAGAAILFADERILSSGDDAWDAWAREVVEAESYTPVAAAVGAPGAARAVGAACAANPVAIVVPCHRVVGGDGLLHGYAYGLERKRQLLEAERPARDLRGVPKQRSSRVREVKSCQAPLQTSVSDH
jgi:O-6-methylguanine DNA methyltransferase